jgi:hypothetical protein
MSWSPCCGCRHRHGHCCCHCCHPHLSTVIVIIVVHCCHHCPQPLWLLNSLSTTATSQGWLLLGASCHHRHCSLPSSTAAAAAIILVVIVVHYCCHRPPPLAPPLPLSTANKSLSFADPHWLVVSWAWAVLPHFAVVIFLVVHHCHSCCHRHHCLYSPLSLLNIRGKN